MSIYIYIYIYIYIMVERNITSCALVYEVHVNIIDI